MTDTPTLAFIGAGNMAGALVGGLLAADWSPESLRASHPDSEHRQEWTQLFGIPMFESNHDCTLDADVVVLCVKPAKIAEVLPDVAEGSGSRLTISVAAGTPIATLAKGLEPRARIVRAMPNQPARLRLGATGIVCGEHTTDADRDLARTLFESVGRVEMLAEESWIDAVTALAGSGPAFVYRVAAGLAAGGVAAGLPEDVALRLARRTVLGAGALLDDSEDRPEALVAAVASPGGTTVAGLAVLDEHDLESILRAAVAAATRRARELADE